MVVNEVACSRRVFLVLFILCLLSIPGYTQNGSSVWYFGQNAGVNFNSNPPVALHNGALNTWEGCATLTDGQGNLLMYTNGVVAYNKLHQQMPNGFGLGGDESSFQSVALLPKPGADSLVFAFIVEDVDFSTQRFSYSVIDLTLDNNLGDVASKNNLLLQPVAEFISAVKHANGTDYWITVHETGNNNFHCYLFTAGGLNPNPVTTAIGPVIASGPDSKGQIKFSPDGKRLIMPNTSGRFLALFDFDAATGVFSNYKRLKHPPVSSGNLFGAEFSPGGRFAYSASNTGRKIFQWDLISNDSLQMAASLQQVVTGNHPGLINALQLADNGKIYVARTTTSFLAVINSPDMPGALCNYSPEGIDLSPKTVLIGLPTCIQSLFTIPFSLQAQNFCNGDSASFSVQTTTQLSNFQWNFGDLFSGINNTSTSLNPKHVFSAPGTYIVTLTADAGNATYTQYLVVEIGAGQAVSISPAGPVQICAGKSENLFTPFVTGARYQWMRDNMPLAGDTLNTLTVTVAGSYQVVLRQAGQCPSLSQAVQVTVKPSAEALVSPSGPVNICPGTEKLLNAQQSTGSTFAWLRNGLPVLGADAPVFAASSTGNYQVVVSGAGLCADTSDVVMLNWLLTPPAAIFPVTRTSVCAGETVTLTVATIANGAYQWLRNGSAIAGETTPVLTATASGNYQVTVTADNSCFATSQTVPVQVLSYPDATLAADKKGFCDGDSVNLSAPEYTTYGYVWYRNNEAIFGSDGPVFAASSPGNYKVIITNGGICSDTSEVVTLTQYSLPDVKIGVINGPECGDEVTLRATGAATYSWSNGETGSEIRVVPVMPEKYIVTGQSAEGCFNSDFEDVNSDCPAIVPNIMTPNGDGVNDVFVLKYPIQDYDLQVFNRWGKVVFERKNYARNPDWKGDDLPEGVYFYSISTFKGEQYKGWVEIIR